MSSERGTVPNPIEHDLTRSRTEVAETYLWYAALAAIAVAAVVYGTRSGN
jgi:hypothetical protein